MRSLKRVFYKLRDKYPFWSDYLCFAEAVHGRNFSKRTIIRNFNALVDREDCVKVEKKQVIEFLVELSKHG